MTNDTNKHQTRTTTTIFTIIYKKLMKLAPGLDSLEVGDAMKSCRAGYMDLNLDVLEKEGIYTTIALAHYYKHESGDMIPDPDMVIRICHEHKTAEALTIQDSFGYRVVYPEPGKIDLRVRSDLNPFLNKWLRNCILQEHHLKKLEG